MPPCRLTVVVPVHNGEADLAACLEALRSSDLAREEWQLIVVDDASNDRSAQIAATFADRVITLSAPAHGPAFARNRGVEMAGGDIVAFIDADVTVHRDALPRMLASFGNPAVSAVFGSYDDRPSAPGVVSQYRNLLHHFVHTRAAGKVESFWAGCGAVRRSALMQVGLFDELRFTRPEMEDVELGYRLADAGYAIELDPAIQCTHRKRITLGAMIKSDFTRRGVPWTRLLLDRKETSHPRGLSLGTSERLSAISAVLFVAFTIAAVVIRTPILAVISLLSLLLFIGANARFLRLLARVKGVLFLAAALPLQLIYSVTAVAAFAWGVVSHPFIPARERYTHRQ
jgi:glycosyltransferase involved in cell wall biosynthesis